MIDRDARVADLDDEGDRLLERRVDLERRDRDARDHDLVDAPLTQLDDRVDHLLLLGLERPLLRAALDDEPQLLGAHLRLVHPARPEGA